MMLVLSVIVCVTLCGVADFYSQSALRGRVVAQLSSVRDSRATQIESYFANVRSHLASLCQDLTVLDATRQFSDAMNQPGVEIQLDPPQYQTLVEYYQTEIFPELRKRGDGDPVLENYLPSSPFGRVLQYHYLSGIDHEITDTNFDQEPAPQDPYGVTDPEKSSYAKSIDRFDRPLRRMRDAFGYDDIFLIDIESLSVIYSASKRIDLGTNLRTGPYSSSSLAATVRRAADSPNKDFVAVEDFQFYAPSLGRPAAFMAAPVYDKSAKVGVIAVQIPIQEINEIVTLDRQWAQSGLGQSGEVILVGRDKTMRNDSRQLLEDPSRFIEDLKNTQLSSRTIQRISELKTTILLRPVENEATELAADGETGVSTVEHLRDYQALTSYRPLQIDGLQWSILAQIGSGEAFEPLTQLRRTMVLCSAGLLLATTLLAMLLAANLTRPIDKFVDDSRAVVTGEREWLNVRAGDEFGVLAYELNKLIGGLRGKTEVELNRRDQADELLDRLMPPRVVSKLRNGETKLIEAFSNVSVLTARLTGFDSNISGNDDTDKVESHVLSIDRLVRTLDSATDDHRIEKVKADGPIYTVTCGTAVPRLDHARRVVQFARDVQRQVRAINQQNDTEVTVHIGIASGPIVAGVVGQRNMIYDVWGSPVERSEALASICPSGLIAIDAAAHRSLGDSIDVELMEIDGESIAVVSESSLDSVS